MGKTPELQIVPEMTEVELSLDNIEAALKRDLGSSAMLIVRGDVIGGNMTKPHVYIIWRQGERYNTHCAIYDASPKRWSLAWGHYNMSFEKAVEDIRDRNGN